MSAETVAELQDLLAQWQKLNLQDSSPELDGQLAAAVSTAKAQIRQHSKKRGQEENSTRDGGHRPLASWPSPGGPSAPPQPAISGDAYNYYAATLGYASDSAVGPQSQTAVSYSFFHRTPWPAPPLTPWLVHPKRSPTSAVPSRIAIFIIFMTTTVSIYMSYYAPLDAPPRTIVFAPLRPCAPDQHPHRDNLCPRPRLHPLCSAHPLVLVSWPPPTAGCTLYTHAYLDGGRTTHPGTQPTPHQPAADSPVRRRTLTAPSPVPVSVCSNKSVLSCPSVRPPPCGAHCQIPAGRVHPPPAPAPAHLVLLLRAPGRSRWVMEWCLPPASMPHPSALSTPTDLTALLSPFLQQAELNTFLAIRTRTHVVLAVCTAAPPSGGGSGGVSLALDHELRRTVLRDADKPRRRRKHAKELGREIAPVHPDPIRCMQNNRH
ncbi:hypothetical protein B0H14DRAFT_3873996 [Mycena olivaceomarginata]|nr:hypothetical protein B0H14DRAFT_3873996 [Mycena olivaceomarginata]